MVLNTSELEGESMEKTVPISKNTVRCPSLLTKERKENRVSCWNRPRLFGNHVFMNWNACTSQANGQAKFLVHSSMRAPCTVFSCSLSLYLRVYDLQQPGNEHLKSVMSSFLCYLSYLLSIAILQQSLDWYMSTCLNCSSINRTLTWSQAVAWYIIGSLVSLHSS